jgi:hypothetical protein
LKKPFTKEKKRTGGVAQGVDPELKPQYCQKKKKNSNSDLGIREGAPSLPLTTVT